MIEITEHLLVKLAGQAAYERGVAYHREDRITTIDPGDRHTTATVLGTEPYFVRLSHTARQLEGACDCPASEGIDFCKHCVAVALALRERQADGMLLEAGTDADKLKAYLKLQSPEFLVSELHRASQQLPELKERLLLQADLATGKGVAARLKKAVTRVTRPRQLWEFRQVAAYFARIEASLENIMAVSAKVPPDVLLKTTVYAMQRVEKALEQIDDSGGYRFATYGRLQELHTDALGRVDWSSEKKAIHLLDLVLQPNFDVLSEVPLAYSDALGEAGLSAFFSETENRLNALPPLSDDADFREKLPYLQLTGFLMEHAAELEDWDSMIELELRTATSGRDYRRIALLCLRNVDTTSATEWLHKADALDGGGGADGAAAWVAVHSVNGDWNAALQAQQRVFWIEPTYSEFTHLDEIAARAGCAKEVRSETVEQLRNNPGNLKWQAAQRAFTLAQILKSQEDWQGVHSAIIERVDDPERLQQAAAWLEQPKPEYACDLYARTVEGLISRKKRTAYLAAAKVLKDARSCFETAGPDKFSNLIQLLRTRHTAKRSLLAILDTLPE